jgi:hypothetical protein
MAVLESRANLADASAEGAAATGAAGAFAANAVPIVRQIDAIGTTTHPCHRTWPSSDMPSSDIRSTR